MDSKQNLLNINNILKFKAKMELCVREEMDKLLLDEY